MIKKDIAEAITTMYKNKDELKIIREIGKSIVEKNFTQEKLAQELEKFIKKIFRRHMESFL